MLLEEIETEFPFITQCRVILICIAICLIRHLHFPSKNQIVRGFKYEVRESQV